MGVSLVQALVVGGLFGLLVLYRTERVADGDSRSRLYAFLAGALERAELASYDVRARALGATQKPSDQVVVVAIDDETLERARQNEHPGLAMQPWARELLGGVVEQLLREGAALVVIDLPFSDLSPRSCPSPEVSGLTELLADDAAFRAQLDRRPGQTLLAFSWREGRGFATGSDRVRPLLMRVGKAPSEAGAEPLIRTILGARRLSFLVPAEKFVEVFAEVSSEPEGKQLAAVWGVPNPTFRPRVPADDAYARRAEDLLVALAEVQVEGLDPEKLTEVRYLAHPVAPLLASKSVYGSVNAPPDPDGVVRALPHLVRYVAKDGRTHVLPSAPLAAALQLSKKGKSLRYAAGRLSLNDELSIPLSEDGFGLIHWDAAEGDAASNGTLKRAISAWRVVVNMEHRIGGLPPRYPNGLEGKTVVLTDTSTYATDFKPTPVGGTTAGGAVLGQSLVNILSSRGIERVSREVDFGATLVLAFLGAFLALTLSTGFRSAFGAIVYLLLVAAAGVSYYFAVEHLFVEQRLWVALVGPLMAMGGTFVFATLYASRAERRLKEFINSVLGRYVSPEVARQVTSDLSLVRPERRSMSIYFSDIEGFSALSEKLEPERLVLLLNEYLTEMTAVVRRHKGQVDKYIGDSVMAFWGAPVRTERHAHLACLSALDMRAALLAKQAEWEKRFGHRIEFRAGINSGEVVVGDMGSDLKSNYTVMGEVVNVASRLEGANKRYGTFILVGEATRNSCVQDFWFREVDRVRVKGKPQPSRIFELLARIDGASEQTREMLQSYGRARQSYLSKDFSGALELFNAVASGFNDPLSALYVARCREFLAAPPPEDWDGVLDLKEK